MKINSPERYISLFGIVLLLFVAQLDLFAQTKPQWPSITQQMKPWTRWWWEGSAVNRNDLTWMLEEYHKVGLGGVEITPIYGVKGYEKQFINFTSPKWMEMLKYTLKEGQRLDLGVDMALASGWPFGGPWVKKEDASKYITHRVYTLGAGEQLEENIQYIQPEINTSQGIKLPLSELDGDIANNPNPQVHAYEQVRFEKPLPLKLLMAYSTNGETLDLTSKVDDKGRLDWIPTSGDWKLYALFQGLHGKMVERAGPGGEGYAIDHFSEKATENYLDHFNKRLTEESLDGLRAFFNDSYEVDDARGEANWTPDFFKEFKTRKGYDLREYLPALFGEDTPEKNSRILCDYRETVADLLLENFTRKWWEWSHDKHKLIRSQAHGSPANILDLYAQADIPETEGEDLLKIKMASSAAHVTGKPLASSESATWLNEHFTSTLGDVKKAMDLFLLGGINHTFYHGSSYTPKDAPWPGWLFYAAVHFTPNNPLWEDFSGLNDYITRCQSFMQRGKPANDILLYYPVFDMYSTPGKEMLQHVHGIEKGSAIEEAALAMQDEGYSFDFISDIQLREAKVVNENIALGGIRYQTVVIPAVKYMPLETFQKLMDLANKGVKVIIHKTLPEDVPGFYDLAKRQKAFQRYVSLLTFSATANGLQKATIGRGGLYLGDNLTSLLTAIGVDRESMVDQELRVITRKHDQGYYYLIKNESGKAIDNWVPIKNKAASVALFNPMTEQTGYAATRELADNTEIYLQLAPGETCILETSTAAISDGIRYPYVKKAGDPILLEGEWNISFTKGGPILPTEINTEHLVSWTEFEGMGVKNFSGTARYTLTFSRPKGKADKWLLDLGEVHESAHVVLNGHALGTVIGPLYQLQIDDVLLQHKNTLEVYVSNGMGNRISYMDKDHLPWKIFYNINMPAKLAENRGSDHLFTAEKWDPLPSGLIGPVNLSRLAVFSPKESD